MMKNVDTNERKEQMEWINVELAKPAHWKVVVAHWPIFSFFAVVMVLQLLFVWKMMPETKGKSLEELGEVLLKK